MLRVRDVTIEYDGTRALDGVSFELATGIMAVIGPSGSGKTSLLRAIAGLEPLAGGSVEWQGEDLTDRPPHRRGFGLVFQDHALFDHQNVAENVGFGLRMQHRPRAETAARVGELLDLVGIGPLAARAVHRLSGGERQRVALARALAPAPQLLMLDEPLASVDRERRDQLAHDLATIVRGASTPTLLVTHDLDEAFTLADAVVVLDQGRVLQVGAAETVWRAPASPAVARFLGVVSSLTVPVDDGQARTPWGPVRTPSGLDHAWLGFRVGGLRIARDAPLGGIVTASWFHRDHYVAEVDTPAGRFQAVARRRPTDGERVTVAADLDAAVILAA